MKKLANILIWVFLILTILSIFWSAILYQKSKYLLIVNLILLLILFIVKAYKRKYSIKKVVLKIFVFLTLSVVAFLAGIYLFVSSEKVCQSDKPEEYNGWKNIKQISLSDIQTKIQLSKDKFNISVLTTIYYQKDTFNIYSIKFNPNKEKKLLIMTGMHGSETAGVCAIPKIIDDIIKNNDKYSNFNIEIVYPLNPVGLKLFSRVNECGCDINRDFKLFKTIQSKLIKELFLKNKYDIVLDLHEGSYKGHAILTNNIIDQSLIQSLNNYLQQNKIKQSSFTSGKGNSIETFIQFYKYNSFISNFGETKMVFKFANDCKLEYITSESDAESEDYEMRINSHVLMFKGIMSYLTNKK